MTREDPGEQGRPETLRERIRGSRVLAQLGRVGMVVYMLQVGNVYYGGPVVIGPALDGVLVATLAVCFWVAFSRWRKGRREWRAWRCRASR